MKRQARLAKYEYRRTRKKFLNRLLFILTLTIVIVFALNKAGVFNVVDIKVKGNERLKSANVIKASGIKIGESYFSLSPDTRERDIEKIPLVKSAKVGFNLKREAVIKVEERVPKFQVENFLEYYIIDEDMRVIARENSKSELPMIEDNFKKIGLGDYLYKDKDKVEFFKQLIQQSVYENIEDINFQSNNSIFTKDGIQIVIGDFEDLDYKFRMLEEILKDIEATGKNARRIELDKEDPIVMVDEQTKGNSEKNLEESQ